MYIKRFFLLDNNFIVRLIALQLRAIKEYMHKHSSGQTLLRCAFFCKQLKHNIDV